MTAAAYLPFLIQAFLAAGLTGAVIAARHFFGQRAKHTPVKDTAYECGVTGAGASHRPQPHRGFGEPRSRGRTQGTARRLRGKVSGPETRRAAEGFARARKHDDDVSRVRRRVAARARENGAALRPGDRSQSRGYPPR